MAKKKVVIGILGTTLDAISMGKKRFGRWRPSYNMFLNEELQFDRFEMLRGPDYKRLSNLIEQDINNIPQVNEKLKAPKVVQHDLHWKDPWDFEHVYSVFLEWALAYPFNPDKEEYYIHISTGSHIAQIVLFLLVEARFLPGVLLQTSFGEDRSGPADCKVIDLDIQEYDQIEKRLERSRSESLQFLKNGIETKNKHFNRMIQEIEHIALNSKSPILLSGPTGAGKTQLARKVYELKKMKHQIEGEFVEVNCATLQSNLAGSTLFGHKKGAFTGAQANRDGLLLKADQGLLFLDEIGELGLDEQAMLLRALEDKIFTPVGGDKAVSSEFQIIAGTNRDLRQEVMEGNFREDLYARLNLWHFELPSLAERVEDIEPNLEFELVRFADRHQLSLGFEKKAKKKFLDWAKSRQALWLGNFRDLGAAVERMGVFAVRGQILKDTVDKEIERLEFLWQRDGVSESSRSGLGAESAWKKLVSPKWDKLDLFEQTQLEMVVQVCAQEDSLADAGRLLFAESRKKQKTINDTDRLRKYLAKYGLSWVDIT